MTSNAQGASKLSSTMPNTLTKLLSTTCCPVSVTLVITSRHGELAVPLAVASCPCASISCVRVKNTSLHKVSNEELKDCYCIFVLCSLILISIGA